MQPTQTFGRRGVNAAAPQSSWPVQRQPEAASRPIPSEPEAPAWLVSEARAIRPADSTFGYALNLLFGFEGRVQRSTYRLVRFTCYFVFLMLFYSFFTMMAAQLKAHDTDPGGVMGLVLAMFVASVLWMWTSLAMQVKRWHDLDKSWSWLFVGFIPFIGPLWVFVECVFFEGTSGPNRFGPSPKGDPAAVFD